MSNSKLLAYLPVERHTGRCTVILFPPSESLDSSDMKSIVSLLKRCIYSPTWTTFFLRL